MVKLNIDRIKEAEYVRHAFRVTVPVTVSYQETLDPTFWGHVASKLTVGDKIEIVPEDFSWYAEVIVRACSRVHAAVGAITFKEFHSKKENKPASADPDFSIDWKGPQRKYAVIRLADKEVIKDGFASREDGAAWLEENRVEVTA